MKSSTIFARAAKLVANKSEDFSCIALYRVCQYELSKTPGYFDFRMWRAAQQGMENRYAEFFKPERVRQHRPWWSGRHGKCRDQRVLALLFMAAMYESEGD